jgi:hypothetical protein
MSMLDVSESIHSVEVIGFVEKPFAADVLLRTVDEGMRAALDAAEEQKNPFEATQRIFTGVREDETQIAPISAEHFARLSKQAAKAIRTDERAIRTDEISRPIEISQISQISSSGVLYRALGLEVVDGEGRDSRDGPDSRDRRDSRNGRDSGDRRDSRNGRDSRDRRDSRNGRDSLDTRDARDSRDATIEPELPSGSALEALDQATASRAYRLAERICSMMPERYPLHPAQMCAVSSACEEVLREESTSPSARDPNAVAEGSLAGVPPFQVLQLAENLGGTVLCRFVKDDTSIEIWLRERHVLFARDRARIESPEELVFEVLGWTDGRFSVLLNGSLPSNIDRSHRPEPLAALLLEGLSRIDEEWKKDEEPIELALAEA